MPFPDICVDDRERCPNEWPTIRTDMMTEKEVTIQVKDKDGTVLQLDAADHIVCVVAKETTDTINFQVNKNAEITNGAEGEITLTLDETDTNAPGIFVGEVVIYENLSGGSSSSSSSPGSQTGAVLFRYPFYLEIARNIAYYDPSLTGFSIAEVRLMIRDKCSEDNFLLDSVEFSDTEIAWAITHPVEYWNEIPPPLTPVYTTKNFPYRYNWSSGIIGELLGLAALSYERNRLQYSAANLAVDDKDKANYYTQASRQYLKDYQTWVLQKKKALNLAQMYGSTSIHSFGNSGLRPGLRSSDS